MARSYHNLGMVAQDRGDYEAALDWYRRSLAIKEELGNRAGMAISMSQTGILLTETGRPADGVAYNLRALLLSLDMQLPQARIDIRWLGRQQARLGQEPFLELTRHHLDDDSLAALLQILSQSDR